MDAERSNSQVETSMGYGMAESDYIINDSSRIHLAIIDCAGPAGAGLYNHQWLSRYSIKEDNEEGSVSTVPFRNGSAIETCSKKNKICKLTFFTGNRLLVTLEGEYLEISAIKQAASDLSLKLQ